MTIGISKERLEEMRKNEGSGGLVYMSQLLDECTELDPWKPIDENTPKDRVICGVVDGKVRLIKWGKTSHVPLYGFCLSDQGIEDFDICRPTHYKELPDPPK